METQINPYWSYWKMNQIVIDILIYKNHIALLKKLNVFLGDHHNTFKCRRCLNSYTSENMLMLHKQKCGEDNIITLKTSTESQI